MIDLGLSGQKIKMLLMGEAKCSRILLFIILFFVFYLCFFLLESSGELSRAAPRSCTPRGSPLPCCVTWDYLYCFNDYFPPTLGNNTGQRYKYAPTRLGPRPRHPVSISAQLPSTSGSWAVPSCTVSGGEGFWRRWD